ncbi:MAG TPA: peptide deformylase [Verrucomicrobiales bacterium]|nr:peptide deformylase [Verrucomicrobiales bacterium]HIL70533.1 peptide deformylase [Verrucomicrobiota bacterium]
MILNIVQYGNPILRKPGRKVDSITPEILAMVDDMFETMHEARGIGLAAQQIGQAIRLTVIDITGVTERASTAKIDKKEVDPNELMPLVLINPEVTGIAEEIIGPEGCLSFPEIYGDISRPEAVKVTALDRNGEKIEFECGGLLAKAVQHENDHLKGILYIDRMSSETKQELQPDLDTLQNQTKKELKKKDP